MLATNRAMVDGWLGKGAERFIYLAVYHKRTRARLAKTKALTNIGVAWKVSIPLDRVPDLDLAIEEKGGGLEATGHGFRDLLVYSLETQEDITPFRQDRGAL